MDVEFAVARGNYEAGDKGKFCHLSVEKKMKEGCYLYVMFIVAGQELPVVEALDKFFEHVKKRCEKTDGIHHEITPFVPHEEKFFRRKNKESGRSESSYKYVPMMPGYVFIETTMPEDKFAIETAEFIRSSSNMIRILKYGDSQKSAVVQEEKKILELLFKDSKQLGRSIGYVVGDKIIIIDGALKGHESLIKKVNRHNREARLELEFMGEKVYVRVPLEIIAKMSEDEAAVLEKSGKTEFAAACTEPDNSVGENQIGNQEKYKIPTDESLQAEEQISLGLATESFESEEPVITAKPTNE